jgi:hypothetical protein
MFPFGSGFLPLNERSCGKLRGLTVGQIGKLTATGTLHRRKYYCVHRCLAKIESSAFVGFVVFGDVLQ